MNAHPPRDRLEALFHQLARYAFVGILTNGIGFGLYILATHYGGTPKATMTVLYAIGTLIGFLGNRKFTFNHDGHIGAAGVRYVLAQLMGYVLNFLILMMFVDVLGFSHQIVQAAAIFIVAAFLFLLSRFFVFAPARLQDNQ